MRFWRTLQSPTVPTPVASMYNEAKGRRGCLTTLYEDWLQAGQQWAGSSIVARFSRTHTSRNKGRYRLMSRKELLDKYVNEELVNDLVERKRKEGLAFPDTNFPECKELEVYKCWDATLYETEDAAAEQLQLRLDGEAGEGTVQTLIQNQQHTFAPGEVHATASRPPASKQGRGKRRRGEPSGCSQEAPASGGPPGSCQPRLPPQRQPANQLKAARALVFRKVKHISSMVMEAQGWPAALIANKVPQEYMAATTRTSETWKARLTTLRSEMEQLLASATTDASVTELEDLLKTVANTEEEYQAACLSVKRLTAPTPKAKGQPKGKARRTE